MAGLGFFAPLPIALMIPFMASQSLAMGEAFGKGFQYGKRRISALTNEEFNKLSAKQMHIETTAEIASMIPNMRQSMDNFAALQPEIIRELLKYAEVIGKELIEFGTEKIEQQAETVANFDYLKSFTDWIMGQGTANEQATLALLQKAGLSAEARISQDAKSQQLINQQLAAKAAKDLADIQNELTLAQRAAAIAKQKADLLDLDKQGPTITPRPPPQAPNTLVVDKFGNISNVDVRNLEVKKPRAPKSICTQIKKYSEEVKSLNRLRANKNVSSAQRILYGKRLNTVGKSSKALSDKYDTSKC